LAALMRRLLALAGIRPPVEVTADGKPVDACEVVRFTDGRVRYVTLVRDPGVHGLQPQDVTIRLPQAAHVYDVRRKQSLGRTETVRANLVPGEPKVYALLPYSVESIEVRRGDEPDSPEGPEGRSTGNGSIPFLVTLDLAGHEPAGRHCLHVEVYGPDGSPRRHYAQNVLAEARTAKVSVPLALDDPAGTWKLRIGDVASGRTAEIAFDVAGSVDRERGK